MLVLLCFNYSFKHGHVTSKLWNQLLSNKHTVATLELLGILGTSRFFPGPDNLLSIYNFAVIIRSWKSIACNELLMHLKLWLSDMFVSNNSLAEIYRISYIHN